MEKGVLTELTWRHLLASAKREEGKEKEKEGEKEEEKEGGNRLVRHREETAIFDEMLFKEIWLPVLEATQLSTFLLLPFPLYYPPPSPPVSLPASLPLLCPSLSLFFRLSIPSSLFFPSLFSPFSL